jgi:Glycine-rich domain-containing protein-like
MSLMSRDVAIVFHAHCLAPVKFFEDVLRRDKLTGIEFLFPMKRLNDLIISGTWSDHDSEQTWNNIFSNPYQLWDRQPKQGGSLNIQRTEARSQYCRAVAKMETDPYAYDIESCSYDVVAAALRQKLFAEKIIKADFNLNSFDQSTLRYYRFMLLTRKLSASKRGKRTLVPTMDIDLAWHTHQLYASAYREWCLEMLGRVINHDDSVTDVAMAFRWTSVAWFDEYAERYTLNDLRRDYLSYWRVIAGVLCPPYGLHVMAKSRKLRLLVSGNPFRRLS